jgi:hypothetical protein
LVVSSLISVSCSVLIAILMGRFFMLWGESDIGVEAESVAQLNANLLESVTVLNIAFVLDASLRLISCIGLFLLFIAFPQRVGNSATSRGTVARPEQIALVFLLIFLILTPSYAIWGSIIWWINYGVIWTTYGSSYSDLVVELWNRLNLYNFDAIWAYTRLIDSIVVTYIFMLWGTSLFFFGSVYEYMELPGNSSSNGTTMTSSSGESSGMSSELEAATRKEVEAIEKEFGMARYTRTLNKAQKLDPKYRKYLRQCKKSCISAFHHLQRQIPLGLCFLCVCYFLLFFGSSFQLHYSPSLLPIVGVITAIRTCVKTSWTFNNVTVVSNITNWKNICGPDNPTQLWRTVSVCALAILEIALMIEIHKISARSRENLNFVPYAKTRARQLGYRYFRATTIIVSVFFGVIGILVTSFGSLQPWYLTSIDEGCTAPNNIAITCPNENTTLTIYVDPLYTVGVNPNSIGFGPYIFLLFVWIYLASYAQLPADSFGIRGWFCRATEQQLQEEMFLEDYTVYVTKEAVVEQELTLQSTRAHHRVVKKLLGNTNSTNNNNVSIPQWLKEAVKNRKNLRNKKKQGNKNNTTTTSGGGDGDGDEERRITPIKRQILSNALVLETELLLFHMMYISYTVCEKVVTSTLDSMSFEQKKALVQDKRYSLIAHIENEETDTHCLLVASEDRIIVAFRGTVSYKNAQTDWDYAEVVSTDATQFQPQTVGMTHREKFKAMEPPRVHQGFIKAYDSVKTELSILLETLWREQPDRALFLTGHSLGGGLALVAALELKVRYQLPPDSIAVTTWGSPKAGTYSFAKRYERAIPCVKRFVHSGDLVTSLPVGTPLSSLLLNGWYHIGVEILLDATGNMLIRPSQVENFFTHTRVSNVTNHLRLTYATSLMAWCVRSHGDFIPDCKLYILCSMYKKVEY